MATPDQPKKPQTRPSDEIHTSATVPPTAGEAATGHDTGAAEMTSGYDSDESGSVDAGHFYDGQDMPTQRTVAPGNTNGMDHDGVMEDAYNDDSQQIGTPVSGFDNPTDGDSEAPGIIEHKDDHRAL